MDATPSYYTVIPAKVRYDTRLKDKSILLYGEIVALSNKHGYCYASNAALARLLRSDNPELARRHIQVLEECGYIRTVVERDSETHAVTGRRIYLLDAVETDDQKSRSKSEEDPPHENEGSSPQNRGDPPLKNGGYNNTSNNNTPIVPKGDAGARSGFERFWAAYPRKVAKPRAEAAWRRLHPSAQLEQKIMNGLTRAKDSGQWQRDGGRYIPHPASWLNARRWEDQDVTEAEPVPQVSEAPAGIYW